MTIFAGYMSLFSWMSHFLKCIIRLSVGQSNASKTRKEESLLKEPCLHFHTLVGYYILHLIAFKLNVV
jgi:hypothetical protein